MHVLRAEKGYPIIGQDTDGTVTPHDLGMGWVVSKKKPTSSASARFAGADTPRPDRKQLVGLLPVDPARDCRRARSSSPTADAAAAAGSDARATSRRATAAPSSAAPSRWRWSRAGKSRIGETLHVPVDGALVPVEVTGSVLVDPEGARRDG